MFIGCFFFFIIFGTLVNFYRILLCRYRYFFRVKVIFCYFDMLMVFYFLYSYSLDYFFSFYVFLLGVILKYIMVKILS